MNNWTRVLGCMSLSVVFSCSDESASGGAEDRGELGAGSDGTSAGQENDPVTSWGEELDTEEGPCVGEPNCAWWAGRVQVQGVWWDLDEFRPVVDLSHCSERTKNTVMIRLSIPTELTGASVERDLLRVTAYPKYARLDTAQEYQPTQGKVPWKGLAYVSVADRLASAQRPEAGTILFRALEEGEPLDMIYELDFGEFGSVRGQVKSQETTAKVCEIAGKPDLPESRPRP